MAMIDYPYPASFLAPLPGFPVDVASQFMNSPGQSFTDEDLAMMGYNASQVYYNYTGTGAPYCIDYTICGDTGTATLGDAMGWPWQVGLISFFDRYIFRSVQKLLLQNAPLGRQTTCFGMLVGRI